MIRVVIDTNIFASALLQPLGQPAQVLILGLNGPIQQTRRFRLDDQTITAALDAIRSKAIWVRATDSVTACSDPDDNMFLECAQAAQADYLVTGNLKHFPASWEGTRVVTARRLLEITSAGDEKKPPE